MGTSDGFVGASTVTVLLMHFDGNCVAGLNIIVSMF